MRRRKHSIILAIVLIAALVLTGCGGNKTTSKAKKKEYKDAKLTIVESGWSYSQSEGVIYYAIKVKNESKIASCLYPDIEVELKDGNDKTVESESVKLPKIAPGQTVSFGSVGPSLNYAPIEVKFSVDSELLDWEEDVNAKKDAEALSVVSCSVRAGESEDNSNMLSGFDEGMSNLNDFLKENGSSQSYDTSVESEANDNSGKQYFGTIHNDGECSYDVVVVIIFKDAAGNIIGGENSTVGDIKQKSDKEFIISSFNETATSNYEVFVYPW